MKWVSVFGTENKSSQTHWFIFMNDQVIPDVNDEGDITCGNCPEEERVVLKNGYIYLVTRSLLAHFQMVIYVVIPSDEPDGTTLFVADGESPKYLNKILDL